MEKPHSNIFSSCRKGSTNSRTRFHNPMFAVTAAPKVVSTQHTILNCAEELITNKNEIYCICNSATKRNTCTINSTTYATYTQFYCGKGTVKESNMFVSE